jgi:uncharacterized membrane protein YdfJ with MMPL/SSD domain
VSALTTTSAGHVPAIPDSGSEQLKLTVTVLFVQVPDVYAPPPATVAEAVIVGASLSMSMSLTVVPALLPALSTAVPPTDWFAPLAVSV